MSNANQPAYVGMWNKHNQCVVVRAADLGKSFVRATWGDYGMNACGTCAVEAGETDEQAAIRAFGAHIPTRYRNTLIVRREELRSER